MYRLKLWAARACVIACAALCACAAGKRDDEKIPPPPTDLATLDGQQINYLNQAIERNPEQAELYYRRAKVYLETGKENLALRDIENALSVAPDCTTYLVVHAHALEQQEQYPEALAVASRIAQRPNLATDAEFDLLYGKLLYINQQPDRAKAYLTQAQQWLNDSPEAHYYLGLIYRDQADTLAAANAFDQAIRLKPEYDSAYVAAVRMYLALGRPMRAITYAKRGLLFGPQNAQLTLLMAQSLAQLDEEATAMLWYEKALKIEPSLWRAAYTLAMYHLKKEHYAEAAQFLKQALSYKPDIERGSYTLAAIYNYRLFNYAEALKWYETAASQNPQNTEIADDIARMKRRIAYQEYKKSPQYLADQMRKRKQAEAEQRLKADSVKQ